MPFRTPLTDIRLAVLDPIPTTGLTAADVDELARSTRALMLDELYALTEKARGQSLPRPQDDAMNGAAKTTGSDARVAA